MKTIRITTQQEWKHITQEIEPQSFLQTAGFWEFALKRGYSVYAYALFEEDTDLLAYALAYTIPAKRGKFMAVSHGPVFKSGGFKQEEFSTLDGVMTEAAQQEGCVALRYAPPWSPEYKTPKGFLAAPLHLHAEQTWVIDVSVNEDMMLQNMRKNTRSLVRKAIELEKSGELSTKFVTHVTDEMMAVYTDTTKRGKFVGYSKRYLQDEFESFRAHDDASMLCVYHKEKLLSWGMFLHCGSTTYYHHGANLLEKSLPSAYLFYWRGLLDAHYRGMKRYDLWGIAPKNAVHHPWKNISLFKSGFGGEYYELAKTFDKPLSPMYWITWAIERFRSYQRGFSRF